MSYQFVEQLHKKAVTVERLCRVLGVSRSGYCGARQRAKIAPKACLVSTQLKAEFAASGKVYGSRRLGAVLRAQGLHIGRFIRSFPKTVVACEWETKSRSWCRFGS